MDIKPLETGFSISADIAKEDLPRVAALGFRSVISNRFDGEDPHQSPAREMREAAAAVGLEFVHIPVGGMAIGDGEIAALRHTLEAAPGPVLGFCRSGLRTIVLWALAQTGRRSADDVLKIAAGAGYDLSPLRPQLEHLS